MLRPLWLDLLTAMLPLVAGLLAFLAGRALWRLPAWIFRLTIGLTVCGVALVGIALCTSLADLTGAWLHAVGGTLAVTCVAALLLLGVVWRKPGRSTSSLFLAVVIGLAGLLLFQDGGGRLFWRSLASSLWENKPDRNGLLSQTTGWTCSPATAAMLLHRYGISSSEGELAYLAGTSLLGTDLYSITDALNAKLRAHGSGYQARIEAVVYEVWVGRGEPFLVPVNLPGLGAHAVLVERAEPEGVLLVDPRFGTRQRQSRQEFLAVWIGRGIRVAMD